MKKIIVIYFLVLLLTSCQSTSAYESYVLDAYQMNENIEYDNQSFSVTKVSRNILGQSIYPDEDLIYIYFNVDNELNFTSSELTIMLHDESIRNAYMIDGLDYLTGPQQSNEPFVRFSVPSQTSEIIMFINDSVYIYLTWE